MKLCMVNSLSKQNFFIFTFLKIWIKRKDAHNKEFWNYDALLHTHFNISNINFKIYLPQNMDQGAHVGLNLRLNPLLNVFQAHSVFSPLCQALGIQSWIEQCKGQDQMQIVTFWYDLISDLIKA